MNIFLFGAQGAGKSTIGKYLAGKLKVPFIATGDIFRQLREEDSETGRRVKSLYDRGGLSPDDLTMQIVNKRINESDTEKGFILDGAPRNLVQEGLMSKQPDLIIMVSLSETEALKRMLDRGRVDDTEEGIKKRLGWYKEKVTPVIELYKNRGVKFFEVDNTPAEAEVEKVLDGLFEN
ncbi:MAG: nucleoside monophosphate kinase [bacterium]|nr:nucleoside monophosphate kinase [bacterium]